MTPEERQLVTSLFERLRQSDHGDRDPEAQQLIEAAMTAHPGAPYLMAQLLLVQDRALSAAQAQIRSLQQELATARSATQQPAANRSFEGSQAQRGPWGDVPAAAAPVAPAAQPRQSVPSAGGGFLRGALQTAAGVAGGALLFEGISSLFHMGSGGWGHGLMPGSFLGGGEAPTLVEETVINEYGDRQTPTDPAPVADSGNSRNDGQFLPDDAQADAADWSDNGDFGDGDIDNV